MCSYAFGIQAMQSVSKRGSKRDLIFLEFLAQILTNWNVWRPNCRDIMMDLFRIQQHRIFEKPLVKLAQYAFIFLLILRFQRQVIQILMISLEF